MTPTLDQLKRAVQIAEQIEKLEAQLSSILGSKSLKATPIARVLATDKPRTKRKYNMSPEARERIAAAQRKRWAKSKRAKKASDSQGES